MEGLEQISKVGGLFCALTQGTGAAAMSNRPVCEDANGSCVEYNGLC